MLKYFHYSNVFFLGFSDKDLEDILGGGGYKPDQNKGRNISLSDYTPNCHSNVDHSVSR